ncbi:MAG: hypothetical protein D6707_10265 [Bacteroidetes bacterium]|jgi:hypothetical protein|nr:MAG: hypothetical protein D6707_10265 [Bacteroidota bacterium]
MKTYKVTLHIAASSPQELEEKLQAFQDLQDHLSHEDFIQAATVVVENPALIEFIKEVAPEEGQELSLGDYLSIARKAFTRFG